MRKFVLRFVLLYSNVRECKLARLKAKKEGKERKEGKKKEKRKKAQWPFSS